MASFYQDKVAIVTGASSGIGKQTSLLLASKGTHVVALARRKKLLDELAGQIKSGGGQCTVFVCDVTDREAVARTAKKIRTKYKAVDFLVNNAGYGRANSVLEESEEQIRALMETSYFGMIYMLKEFLPGMVERGQGSVANLGSIVSELVFPYFGPYSAAKFAVAALTESLHLEMKGSGIKISLILPGPADTAFFDDISWQDKRTVFPRVKPQEVAKTIVKALRTGKLVNFCPSYLIPVVWSYNAYGPISRKIVGVVGQPKGSTLARLLGRKT